MAGGPKRSTGKRSSKAALLLYGVPGVGKTSLIGTGPNTCIIRPPTDHVDPIIKAGNGDNFDDVVVSTWGEIIGDEGLFRWIQKGGYKEYEWFWFDSMSLWQDIGLKNLFDIAVDRNEHRADFGLDKQEYGINQFRINTFVQDMVKLVGEDKLNFGITCHTMEWYNPNAETTMWAPNIQGREGLFMQKICGMMKTVAYYYLAKPEGKAPYRVLKTETDKDDVFVKDQLGIAPKGRLKNPTMADINAVLNGNANTRRPAKRRRRTTRRRKA